MGRPVSSSTVVATAARAGVIWHNHPETRTTCARVGFRAWHASSMRSARAAHARTPGLASARAPDPHRIGPPGTAHDPGVIARWKEPTMDDARFDAWTRRKLGWSAVALGAALTGLIEPGDADARKNRRGRRRRRDRCLRVNQPCRDGGKKRCCKHLNCDEGKVVLSSLSCCRPLQATCTSESECCSSAKCQPAEGLAGNRCCSTLGQPCEVASDCCDGPGSGAFCDSENNCVSPL